MRFLEWFTTDTSPVDPAWCGVAFDELVDEIRVQYSYSHDPAANHRIIKHLEQRLSEFSAHMRNAEYEQARDVAKKFVQEQRFMNEHERLHKLFNHYGSNP